MSADPTTEQAWRALLGGQFDWEKYRKRYGMIPAKHRCKNCNAPFDGIGAWYARLTGRGQFRRNPRFCDFCMQFCMKYPGGTELEISMVFVDVRGSTQLAEGMRAAEFSHLMNRFYKEATGALIHTNAFIDKFVGDQVIGLYFPLFAGKNHAGAAIQGARELLQHDKAIPMGVGVHTGVAYVGTVSGSEGSVLDVTALGDNVNIAARLSSQAGGGEALISEAACVAAGLVTDQLEMRQLELKGKTEPVRVRVLKA